MYRKVKANVYFSAQREWKEVIGKFHQWGQNFEEFTSSLAVPITEAIIELEDGTIVTCPPSNVQFID